MAVFDINWSPMRTQLRLFAAIQVAFFAIVAFFVYRHTQSATIPWIIVAVSAGIGAIGLAFPQVIRVVYVVWMAVIFPIGWVVSHILMALIFYLVFTPVGLIMRLLGRDPMRRRFDREAESYWVARKPTDEKKRYFKQF